jgi:hypothetical protein
MAVVFVLADVSSLILASTCDILRHETGTGTTDNYPTYRQFDQLHSRTLFRSFGYANVSDADLAAPHRWSVCLARYETEGVFAIRCLPSGLL